LLPSFQKNLGVYSFAPCFFRRSIISSFSAIRAEARRYAFTPPFTVVWSKVNGPLDNITICVRVVVSSDNNNQESLKTLLNYNQEDVVNLKVLRKKLGVE
jgi:hypothetical protein